MLLNKIYNGKCLIAKVNVELISAFVRWFNGLIPFFFYTRSLGVSLIQVFPLRCLRGVPALAALVYV